MIHKTYNINSLSLLWQKQTSDAIVKGNCLHTNLIHALICKHFLVICPETFLFKIALLCNYKIHASFNLTQSNQGTPMLCREFCYAYENTLQSIITFDK